ncbi:MAG: YtxH domain-containing protein [Acidobacteria bacterium]|nr:YtxH domain-containing protein [Acidobacteriota bacterium]
MSKPGESFLYFLVGGFVGASLALLLAPKSGKETRDLIAERAKDGAEYLTTKGREFRDLVDSTGRRVQDQAGDLVDRSVEVFNRQREQLSAAMEAGKQAYREEKAKLGEDS